MARVIPDFKSAMKKNLAYEKDYGQYKNVQHPVWTGAEGDRAALFRGSYPSFTAQHHFKSAQYNNYYRTMVTTGLQGKGKSIYDKVQLTGGEDYDTSGRNMKEYSLVSLAPSGLSYTDIVVGTGILGCALLFIMFSNR